MNHEYKEYKKKESEVFEKFTAEFIKGNYEYDPVTNTCVKALIHGQNPYSIIEILIEANKNLSNQLLKEIKNEKIYTTS